MQRQLVRRVLQRAAADLQPQSGRDRPRAGAAAAARDESPGARERHRDRSAPTPTPSTPTAATSSTRSNGRCSRRRRTSEPTTEYSYRRGEASFIEFLDAVRAFNDTMQSYNEARADYARSLYALDCDLRQGEPMKRLVAIGVGRLGAGRVHRQASRPSSAERRASAGSQPGTVVIPPDSPMLEADQARDRGRGGAADRRSDRAGKDRGEPEPRLEGRAAGRRPDHERPGQDRRRRQEGSAAADDSEPGRGRGDVDVPVGAGRASRRREAALIKAQSDFDRSSDLFEHNAVAKKDVLSARERARAGEGRPRTGTGRSPAGARRLAVLGLTPGDLQTGGDRALAAWPARCWS